MVLLLTWLLLVGSCAAIMGAGNDVDFLNSHFPMYAAAAVGVFFVYRAYASKARAEPLQPACMSKGTFPAAFFTFVGSLACHEMFLNMTRHGGGLTAWAPAVLTVLVCSWVAYRGQLAASGGELGMPTILPAVAFASLAVSWMVADEAEDVRQAQKLTKKELKQAAKAAAKKAAAGVAGVMPTKMLSLEKGRDVVTEQIHVALGFIVLVALVLGLVNGPGVWPRNLQQGAFPACFMVATGVLAYNSFLSQARDCEGGSLDDFIPAFAAAIAASFVAYHGSAMQATSL